MADLVAMNRSSMAALAATALAAMLLPSPLIAQEMAEKPTPASIVQGAPKTDWVAIDPADLLVMTLAPDADGKDREVIIQLMPAPFSKGWVENIRTLAKAHWWDGLSIYRSVDNWVVQWGDGEEEGGTPKPLPTGLNVVPESEYVDETVAAKPEEDVIVLWHPRPDLVDAYAESATFNDGWPIGLQIADGTRVLRRWPVHCYGSVGVARDLSPDTGTGAELYAVIGHAPRQLDRNIAVVGRVIKGMQHLSTLPRGTGDAGVYETLAEHTPIVSVRLGNELAEAPRFEYLSTSSDSFAAYAGVSANRDDSFYKVGAGGIDVCNLRVPIRPVKDD